MQALLSLLAGIFLREDKALVFRLVLGFRKIFVGYLRN